MFKYLKKVIAFTKIKEPNNDNNASSEPTLSSDLKENLNTFKEIFGPSYDIVFREFTFGQPKTNAAIIYIDGLVDKSTINQSIIKPLMYDSRFIRSEKAPGVNMNYIDSALLSIGEVKRGSLINELLDNCLSGDTILLIDGLDEALSLSTKGWDDRGVQEPQSEGVVRGPREGFSETLLINTALLRRIIKNPDLIMDTIEIGKRTKTSVCIAYIKELINPELLDEIRNRLKRIDTDAILESGYIEQYIEDAPLSIFPTVANTEKPDVVASKLLEGRAAILVDGTPFVLTVPMLFIESFQAPEDYYARVLFGSFTRILRFLAYLITIFTPALYQAILTFHRELIPTPLLFTLAASQEGLPFPLFFELALMLIVFDILREAGIRLPRAIGQAISIVGALIVGEATVAAGLVSYFTVIVIAVTSVSSFVVGGQAEAANILRYVFLILGALMGGVGIIVGMIGVLIHLANLHSFGIPYLSPMAPLITRDLKDAFIRAPLWAMRARPEGIMPKDLKRQAGGLKSPSPDEEDKP